jgi:transcriptional regulator with XRE-family HTH domain
MCATRTLSYLNFPYHSVVRKKNIIGQNIRKYRKSVGVTQMELAAQLQLLGVRIDRSAVAKIEIGLRPVSDIEIRAIANILKTSIPILFEGSEATFDDWIKRSE